MKIVVAICIMFFAVNVYALNEKVPVIKKAYLTRKPIVEKETQEVTDIDNITISIACETPTIIIRMIRYYLDAEDNILRSERAENIIYQDRVDDLETPEDESSTDYTDFLTRAGIDIEKVKVALK